MFRALGTAGTGGGALILAQTFTGTVPSRTGIVYYVTDAEALLTPLTFSKTGGSANLTINTATGAVSATAAIAVGAVQTIIGGILAAAADGSYTPFVATLTGAVTVPEAPTITGLTVLGDQISVAYTDGYNGGSAVTDHQLWRATSSGAEVLIGTIGTTSPYANTSLTRGATYFYMLKSVNTVGAGASSVEATATISLTSREWVGPAGIISETGTRQWVGGSMLIQETL